MEALGIDIKLLLAQIVNFVLFVIIFKKFIAKPFSSYLKEQQWKEEEKDRLLKEVVEKEAKLKLQETEIVKEAQDQAAKILQDAKKTATAVRTELIKKANEEAEEIRSRAHSQIDVERKELYDEVRAHIIATSASLTKRIMKKFVTTEKQEEIFNKLVKSLDKKDLYEN